MDESPRAFLSRRGGCQRQGRNLELRARKPEHSAAGGLVPHVAKARRSNHRRRLERTERPEPRKRAVRYARGRHAPVGPLDAGAELAARSAACVQIGQPSAILELALRPEVLLGTLA